MCIAHSVTVDQRYNNPLTRVSSVYNGPKGMELERNPHYIGGMLAEPLGGSFKLVTPAQRTVRQMTPMPKETQQNGDTNTCF